MYIIYIYIILYIYIYIYITMYIYIYISYIYIYNVHIYIYYYVQIYIYICLIHDQTRVCGFYPTSGLFQSCELWFHDDLQCKDEPGCPTCGNPMKSGDWQLFLTPVLVAEYSTPWLFNIAMENGPFIDDFRIKTSIDEGFWLC